MEGNAHRDTQQCDLMSLPLLPVSHSCRDNLYTFNIIYIYIAVSKLIIFTGQGFS
jgi:hypothetical protein